MNKKAIEKKTGEVVEITEINTVSPKVSYIDSAGLKREVIGLNYFEDFEELHDKNLSLLVGKNKDGHLVIRRGDSEITIFLREIEDLKKQLDVLFTDKKRGG